MFDYRGTTAIVTGASSGIGEGLAVALAKRGANLALVARREARLKELAGTIGRDYKVKATPIPLDLSQPHGAEDLKALIMDRLDTAPTVLVNNAGLMFYGQFKGSPSTTSSQMIAINLQAPVMLTHAFLPEMLARGSGVVINIASSAAFQPLPYLAVYAATKAFVLSFSEALAEECRNTGVRVTAVCPGPVKTPMLEFPDAKDHPLFGHNLLTVDEVVRAALGAVDRNKLSVIVGWLNYLLANSSRFAPRPLAARIGGMLAGPKST